MNEVYLLIGGNMGDRLHYLSEARKAIEKYCGPLVRSSSVYQTAAWGKQDQDDFLNQALFIHSPLSPEQLLHTILSIEESLGRKRAEKYGPRIMDIDILFYNDEVIDHPGLKVPHPQMAFRRFVLQPLSEIAAELQHPVLHQTVSELLAACTDPLSVNKIS